MAKVLILSDSHGLTKEVEDIKKRHQHEVEAMIHCGDSELAYDAKELQGFYYAKGNCDFEPEMVDEQVVKGRRFDDLRNTRTPIPGQVDLDAFILSSGRSGSTSGVFRSFSYCRSGESERYIVY